MDLPTHIFFGVAIGLVFFGRPEIALLIALGTILPDLDREYWFVPTKVYLNEQYHRAVFHNVFIIALAYLVSPFLSLGIFLHMLQDSFTTSKDRGCEWFYPFSRLVKRGRYDLNGHPLPLDPNERVYFYHEDLWDRIEYAEPDLPEPEAPWRRVYGPALNSSLLDRGFLCGSIVLILVWLLIPDCSNLALWLKNPLEYYYPYLVALLGIVVLFASGELDRRDRDKPYRIPQLRILKIPLLIAGILLFVAGFALLWREIWANLEMIRPNWIPLLVGGLLVALTSFAVVKWQTRKSKALAIV